MFKKAKSKQAVKDQYIAEAEGMIAAFNRSQAVIEFSLDGTILKANQNFLDAMGYTAEEIVGRHHRLFVPADEVSRADSDHVASYPAAAK